MDSKKQQYRNVAMVFAVAIFTIQTFYLYGGHFALQVQKSPASPLKGVSLSGGYDNLEQVAALNVTHVFNWDINLNTAQQFRNLGIEYYPMALLDKPELTLDDAKFRTRVEEYSTALPGSIWFIFNEPEFNRQHPVAPSRAVELFDQLRKVILEVDPAAQFIVGNNSFESWINPEGVDGGTAWLRKFVQLYRDSHARQYPPVLGYGLHLYADSCEWRDDGEGYMDYLDRAAQFTESLHAGAEMWATEWGSLFPGERSLERVMEVGSFWFETHGHVHFWYSTKTDIPRWCPGCAGALMEDGELTPLGRLYRELPRQTKTVFLPYLQN